MPAEAWKFTAADAVAAFPADPAAMRFAYVLNHGTMKLGLYAQSGEDKQRPHRQDELYVVVSGAADFVKEGARTACKASDVLFVEAGKVHRFENASPDFSTWVVFWGPDGGEAAAA
jgi:mannose-6-phosphate isomerase-like protein (cupin superfamily)